MNDETLPRERATEPRTDERPWLTIHGLEQAHRGNGLPDHIPGTYEGRCPRCPSNERVPEGDTK